ncbi:MAG: hypothetical protein CSA45_04315 [Gammaproteobacteria bacterium]|nr:MAG: hypothetical protein CSA45_04315 [Gammaproteobacteria bacterium]
MKQRLQIGFTIIELLIVVTMIAALAVIAIPTYHRYVIKTQRQAVQARLMEMSAILENHYSQKGAYWSDFVGQLNSDTVYNRFPDAKKSRYLIKIAVIDSDGVEIIPSSDREATPYQLYLIKATPTALGNQRSDYCGTLTVNNFHIKGADSDRCWSF